MLHKVKQRPSLADAFPGNADHVALEKHGIAKASPELFAIDRLQFRSWTR